MAELPLPQLLTAATLLARAAQWDAARALLESAEVSPAEGPGFALALADLAVDQDFAQRTTHSPAALAALATLELTPTQAWDRALLDLRHSYFLKLLTPAPDEALATQAKTLEATAPDDSRRATILFYQGLIADNLNALPQEAFTRYSASLALCNTTGDTLQASYAHRHLGDHAHTAGDLPRARTHWQLSTEQRQTAGHVPATLAQQALLAVLAKDEGNQEAAKALATEVNRWAHQLHIPYLQDQTEPLLG
ncbi:hypothetical protein [Kribbella sp. NPDC051770]|uniref:hypothetical protein n=1 Tax=Kribbella sp. NPDC051770 TaxID=3155413 RepID=UPI00342E9E02